MSDLTGLILSSVMHWLHVLATTAWFGGMMANLFVFMPAARRVLDPPVMGKLMGAVMRKFRVLVYVCGVLLMVSGATMSILGKGQADLMIYGGVWRTALSIKLFVIIVMVVLVLYAFEILAPKVGKLALGGPSPELKNIQRKQMAVGILSFLFAMIILVMTGVMEAASAAR